MSRRGSLSQKELEHVEDSSGTRPAWFGDRSPYGESREGRTPGGDRGIPRAGKRETETVKEGHGRRERKREREGAIKEEGEAGRQGTGEKARRKEEKKGGR